MRDVSIIGVGIHPFGRFEEKSYQDIGLEAAIAALKDASIDWREIESAFCSRVFLPASTGPRILFRMGRTGIPILDVEAGCASGGAAIRQAYITIASGMYDTCLVLGVEKMPKGFMDPEMIYEKWEVQMGLSTNPSYWAMRARRHMEDYGTTDRQIAKVAFKNHRNSVNNPNAMYQKEFSMEEIQNSRIVCDPIRLLEVCTPNEGAAAAVLCASDIAARYSTHPIRIAATVHTITQYSADFRAPVYTLSANVQNPGPTEVAGKMAYEMAAIGPEDIDLAEVQDTDAFCEIEIYEQLGFCKAGEGGRLVDEGLTEISGSIPVNVSGGLISKGEPVGASHLGQVHEIVTQLRGLAGPRQVKDAKVGLAHVLGAAGHCSVTILKK